MPVEYGFRPRSFGLPNFSQDGVGGSGGNGEPGRQITPAARETRFDRILNGIPRTEGKPLDPYRVSDALMSYQDQASARIRGLTPKIIVPGEPVRLIKTRAPA